MDALNRLILFIKQHALFLPEDRILLAVSSGRDSIVMAHLFNEAGFKFGIAHCNFNLRGKESSKDEQFTFDLASTLNVPFFSTTFDTAEYAKQNHISIQMAARDLRYQWLEEIREEFGFNYIAIAQHQNDVIETMLLNLTRGTGIAGMHGILPKKVRIIRPLLFLSRDEIDQIVQEQNLKFREDSSNSSTKYARNKIRLNVIPVLKELNPSLEQTFEANRKRFEELEIIFEKRINEIKADLFKESSKNEYEISLPGLKALDPVDTLLYGLFHSYGFTQPVLTDFKNSWNGVPGKIFSSGSYDLNLDRNRVLLTKAKTRIQNQILITHTDVSFQWGDKNYKGSSMLSENYSLRMDPLVAQLDFELLQFPLAFRNWQDGDRFQPLGVNGKKKLSDFFIEQKIPLSRKKEIGILQNGNGDIVWIAGLRIDERYKITAKTKKVFIFEQYT
ncbi:tRNA lysidine(34) synthetase TilS [Daejeonella lutea]|uniref:tRNA(Ile)-lysidine synthase n=1 Tax=Daejeonella lutea TaxID=572036 RepID=A0A1T5CVK2_9SPHI|nr:tRNA lysidine(34) synthetase TilS [Daejeonella lutea]SKB63361.1 tRNA(Ile)-lysidine synthase [Daejeonella lutea]